VMKAINGASFNGASSWALTHTPAPCTYNPNRKTAVRTDDVYIISGCYRVLRAAASNPCVSSTQCYFALRFLLNGKRIYAFMVARLEKNKPLPNRCRRHRWMRHSPGIARAARSRAPRRCRTVATVRQDPAVFLSIQCQSRRNN
jgi:hypothetical protein